MASRAERARRHKARRTAPAQAPPAPCVGTAARAAAPAAPARRESGLDMLRGKGRITAAQAWAGRLYGALERAAQIGSAAAIRSSLADLLAAGGGGQGYVHPTGRETLAAAEWIASCRARLEAARAALAHHAEKIAVVDLICGRGLHPREISQVQREAEQIETVLRVALDDLAAHFGAEGAAPRV